MEIRRALTDEDIDAAAVLACRLWPSHTVPELRAEFASLLEGGAVLFLAEADGAAIGFAQCGLRTDYVQGSHTSPCGYLEGIYVAASHRGQGIARALVRACEDWAREQGCREFASDVELENTTSQQFHRRIGFAEAGRIVCYMKAL